MKKTKIIIPALGILLLSTAASVTGTVAWFAMNESVAVSGMQVKAVAEDGILVINELDEDAVANWKKATTASYASLVALAPTSTANLADWYHASSDDINDAKAGQAAAAYTKISADANWKRDEGSGKSGAYFIDNGTTGYADSDKAYVVLNKFYIKASGNAITLGNDKTYKDLYINKITVTGVNNGETGTAALDVSLRIGVKIGTKVNIYAPVTGATTSYKVAGAETSTSATVVPDGGIVNTPQNASSIPAITVAKTDALEADVFIYFEGEDAGLKSANLKNTLDTLNVSVQFGITEASAS